MPGSTKTARFAAVIKGAGEPVTYVLWSNPRKDAKFREAVAANRVMTVHQEMRGARKDHAEVGYHPDPRAQFLLFPRSLRRFAGKRIVGIDYGRLAERTAPVREAEPIKIVRAGKPPSVREERKVLPFPLREPPQVSPPSRRGPMQKPRPPAFAPLDRAVAGQIRRALRELKGGQNVAAYARLTALLGAG